MSKRMRRTPSQSLLNFHLINRSKRAKLTQNHFEEECDATYFFSLGSKARLLATSPDALQTTLDYFKSTTIQAATTYQLAALILAKLGNEEDLILQITQHLCLLLIQQGQLTQAHEILLSGKFEHHLSSAVLAYSTTPKKTPTDIESDRYLSGFDNALPKDCLSHFQQIFAPSSLFWSEHNYDCEKSSYFSYVHKLGAQSNSMDQLIALVQGIVAQKFPQVKKAKFCEWWAHMRPHTSGHQLHFDSENEGKGGVRNPIVSTVLCLFGGVGGPTLVTNQSIEDQKLAGTSMNKDLPHTLEHGWLVHPAENRLIMFDGKVLHGVVPGRGFVEDQFARRITLMLAFWEDITVRQSATEEPGAARPFPNLNTTLYKWPKELESKQTFGKTKLKDVTPIFVSPIWQSISPTETQTKLPSYEACFQGF